MAHLNFTLIILFRGLGPKAGLIKKIYRETVVVVVFTCPWFKYSLWQKILMNFLLLTVEKTKIKKMRPVTVYLKIHPALVLSPLIGLKNLNSQSG